MYLKQGHHSSLIVNTIEKTYGDQFFWSIIFSLTSYYNTEISHFDI